uniref:OCRE domain-containing protein n=1 Tax=Trypanosoma congolense (strain IL3000) TaxID=1068625 RepID=G0UXU1_TRYCI|nr:conserved hypothetical protein [Trypanosoma congolense IL3000]
MGCGNSKVKETTTTDQSADNEAAQVTRSTPPTTSPAVVEDPAGTGDQDKPATSELRRNSEAPPAKPQPNSAVQDALRVAGVSTAKTVPLPVPEVNGAERNSTVSDANAGKNISMGKKPFPLQNVDDGDMPLVLPKGEWVLTEGTPFYYSDAENLYFHPPSCQFYDPTNEMWYDPEHDEWYRDE